MFTKYSEHVSTERVKTERSRNPRGEGAHLRQELVQAAAELLAEPGPPVTVPLRAVARKVGISPSAAYRWFPSQADLLAAVVSDLFGELAAAIEAEDDSRLSPAERVAVTCRAYAAWGMQHRGAYRLLFERPDLPDTEDAGAVLLDRLGDLRVDLAPEDRGTAARRLWGAVHGLTSLAVHKGGPPWTESLDDDVAATVALHVRPSAH